jgi:hypothetical protein
MTRLALLVVALALPAPASAGAGAALSASPSRLALAGGARETIRLSNPGTAAVVVEASVAGFALDRRGRPRVAAAGGARWLHVTPRRLRLPPGRTARITVVSRPPAHAEPGDHPALLLLSARPLAAGRVAVQVRLGIVVTERLPGAVRRRLELRGLRPGRRGLLELAVRNRGNVTEELPRGRIRVTLLRDGRVLARAESLPRRLLPRTSGVVELRVPARLSGHATAVVELGARTRRYAIRLRST